MTPRVWAREMLRGFARVSHDGHLRLRYRAIIRRASGELASELSRAALFVSLEGRRRMRRRRAGVVVESNWGVESSYRLGLSLIALLCWLECAIAARDWRP